MFHRRMKGLVLWWRIAAGMALGLVVLFVALSLIGERAAGNSRQRVLQEQQIATQMAAGQFDVLLDSHLQMLSLAVLEIKHNHSFVDQPAVRQYLEDAVKQMDGRWAAILVWDTAGQAVFTERTDVSSRWADQTFVLDLDKSSGTTPAFETLRDARDGRPLLAVTLPLDEADPSVGHITALVRLDTATFSDPLVQAVGTTGTGHAALIDSQGRVIVSTDHAGIQSLGRHPTLYRQAMELGEPISRVVPVESDSDGQRIGQKHAMSVAPLSRIPWEVAVGDDVSVIFAATRKLRRDQALLALVTLGAVLGASLVGTRQLVRPVQQLTATAQRIAAGDLEAPLQVAEGGEIGELASALESMRRQLLANLEEMTDLNENLEIRVDERTRELEQQQALVHQLLRQVLTAQEEERARIAYELHDEIGQVLTAVQISLDLAGRGLPDDMGEARQRIERAHLLTEQAIADLRRIISALRPGVLDRLGLVPALEWMANHFVRPAGIRVEISAGEHSDRLPGETETVLFRVAQEALNNVVQHSRAAHVEIVLAHSEDRAVLSIRDDGCGFKRSDVDTSVLNGRGLGLAGMEERMSLAGGILSVESAPGKGTQVEAEIPLDERAAHSDSTEAYRGGVPRV